MDIPKEIGYKIIKYACEDDSVLVVIMLVNKCLYAYVRPLFYNLLRQMHTYVVDDPSIQLSYEYGFNSLLRGRINRPMMFCEHECLPLRIHIMGDLHADLSLYILRPFIHEYLITSIEIRVGHKSVYCRRINYSIYDSKYRWNPNINKRDKPYVLGFLHEYFREIYNIIIWK